MENNNNNNKPNNWKRYHELPNETEYNTLLDLCENESVVSIFYGEALSSAFIHNVRFFEYPDNGSLFYNVDNPNIDKIWRFSTMYVDSSCFIRNECFEIQFKIETTVQLGCDDLTSNLKWNFGKLDLTKIEITEIIDRKTNKSINLSKLMLHCLSMVLAETIDSMSQYRWRKTNDNNINPQIINQYVE